PITERSHHYSLAVLDELQKVGIRAEVDMRSEKIGYKIREGQLQKIPYQLVLGDKEAESGNIAVRHRQKGDLGVMEREDFIAMLQEEIRTKAL
ncbi:MAG: His/Gly/Thr/Pro-type tRNA ligase C-terminal domain-containing protein, partial [Deltaproteobacteria bacterium]